MEVTRTEGRVTVTVDGREWSAEVREDGDTLRVAFGQTTHEIRLLDGKVMVDGVIHEVHTLREPARAPGGPSPAGGPEPPTPGEAAVYPPMPGRIIEVLVEAGASVEAGDPLLILEAMKMQNEIPAPARGTVKEVRVKEGDSVLADDVLLVLA